MSTLWDDVQVVLTHEALQAPAAKRPSRHTEWSNAHSFVDGGYLARIVRETCRSCSGRVESSQGVFHVEVKVGTGTRRLTALPRGGQWPLEPGLPLEIEEVTVDWCAACLRDLGFTTERPAQVGFVHRGQA